MEPTKVYICDECENIYPTINNYYVVGIEHKDRYLCINCIRLEN